METDVRQSQFPRFLLRDSEGYGRTIEADELPVGKLAGIERRKNADSAAEIEDVRGTTDASPHPQSNRVVVVVSLAVQNGKNSRLGGQVVE
jgi:hypothetical protein